MSETTEDLIEKQRAKLGLPQTGVFVNIQRRAYITRASNPTKDGRFRIELITVNQIPPFFFIEEDFDMDKLMKEVEE